MPRISDSGGAIERMQPDLSKYYLKDNPFLTSPIINVLSKDKRINGRLFCKEIESSEFSKLMALIAEEYNMIFVYSPSSVLGTGKSALMAAAYWDLHDRHENPIWAEATGGVATSPTLGRVIDSMLVEGVVDRIKKKIGEFSYTKIFHLLNEQFRPIPGLVGALAKVLQTTPDETAKKFTNIRRSLLTFSATDVFGYLTALMLAAGLKRPVIFIDQFEEFVRTHHGYAMLDRLGNEINDLLRATQNRTTLVVSLHPEAESILSTAASKYIEELAPLNDQTMVRLRPLEPLASIKLAECYLSEYRIEKSEQPPTYPFNEDVLKYTCLEVHKRPRAFIIALHYALLQGADAGFPEITPDFISNEQIHMKIFGKPSEWKKYKDGQLK